MKKKIVVLGSTGSIGKTLLNIIKKNKNNFKIILLSAQKNHRELFKQAKLFNVKNVILTDKKYYDLYKNKFRKKNINISNNFNQINKIFKTKIDYVMSSIVGLDGLQPTLEIIKYSKTIAIANKESIICAWNLISKELKKNKTQFIPVDSEHFSVWYALKNIKLSKVKKIYLTASGGPLLNAPLKKFDKIKINKILKHPNWEMGKKISVDSSTMMNKVFEIIEAKKIFNLNYKKLSILIHPKSYIHAIIEFNDGMIKIILHETTMEIPVFNSLYNSNEKNFYKVSSLNLNKLNNLSLKKISTKRFPITKLIENLSDKNTLYDTVLVSANDALVNLYLNKKIKYTDLSKFLIKTANLDKFKKMKNIYPRNIKEIINLSKEVHSKINTMYK